MNRQGYQYTIRRRIKDYKAMDYVLREFKVLGFVAEIIYRNSISHFPNSPKGNHEKEKVINYLFHTEDPLSSVEMFERIIPWKSLSAYEYEQLSRLKKWIAKKEYQNNMYYADK